MKRLQAAFRITMLLLVSTCVQAQVIRNPVFHDAGDVRALARMEGLIFAGTAAGVFISKDEGRSWVRDLGLKSDILNVFVFKGHVHAVAQEALYKRRVPDGTWISFDNYARRDFSRIRVIGDNLVIATMDGSWISPDGTSWTGIPASIDMVDVRALAVSKQGDLFAFGSMGTQHHSADGGATWNKWGNSSSNGLGGLYFDVHLLFSSDGAKVFSNLRDGSIRRSPDGATIFSIPGAEGYPHMAILGDCLLAGYQGVISRSDDDGDTFKPISSGPRTGHLLEMAAGETTVFARMLDGLYGSLDTGRTWKKLLPGDEESKGLAVLGKQVFAQGGNRLYHSLDEGLTWTSEGNNGPFNASNSRLAITSGGLVHQEGGGSLRISRNMGKDWDSIGQELGPYPSKAICVWKDTLYTGGASGIRASADFGSTWKNPGLALPQFQIISAASQGTSIFAAGKGLWRSSDNGKTWTNAGFGIAEYVHSLAFHGDTLFAYVADKGVYASTGQGAPRKVSELPDSKPWEVQALHVGPKYILVGDPNGRLSLYNRTSNTWITADPDSLLNFSGFLAGPSRLLAFSRRGIFASSDEGLTWVPSMSGLAAFDVVSLVEYKGKLHIGTAHDGIYGYAKGTDWKNVPPLVPQKGLVNLVTDGSTLVADYAPGGLNRINGDGTMERLPLPSLINAFSLDGGTLTAATQSGIFHQTVTDTTTTFTWKFRPLKTMTLAIAAWGLNQAVIGGSSWNRMFIFFSKDGGQSFPDSLPMPSRDPRPSPMAFTHEGDLLVRYGDSLGVVRSGSKQMEFHWLPAGVLSLATREAVWAVGTREGVYLSTNAGAQWMAVDTTAKPAYAVAFSGDTLYAGTYGKVQAIPIPPASAGIRPGTGQKPPPIRMSWLDSRTGIRLRYALSAECRLTLSITDFRGKTMRILDNVRHKPGNHVVDISKAVSGPLGYLLEVNPAGKAGSGYVQSGYVGR